MKYTYEFQYTLRPTEILLRESIVDKRFSDERYHLSNRKWTDVFFLIYLSKECKEQTQGNGNRHKI